MLDVVDVVALLKNPTYEALRRAQRREFQRLRSSKAGLASMKIMVRKKLPENSINIHKT